MAWLRHDPLIVGVLFTWGGEGRARDFCGVGEGTGVGVAGFPDAADGIGFDFDDAILSEHRIRRCLFCLLLSRVYLS